MSRIKPELKALQEFYALQGKKVCNTCSDVLELTATNFTPDKKGIGGFMSRCRRCTNAAARRRAKSGYGFGYALENGYERAEKLGRRRYRVTEAQLVKYLKNKRNHDPARCYYTGVELQTKDRNDKLTYRNLEHVVPLCQPRSMHRVGNIVPSSAAFNQWKRDSRAVTAVLAAPEELQAVSCYFGAVDGFAGTDRFGNPDVPGQMISWQANGCTKPPRELGLEEARAILG